MYRAALPARTASVDCDRARGTCDFAYPGWKRTVPVGDLARADIADFTHGNYNNGAYVDIQLRNGTHFWASGEGRTRMFVSRYEAVVNDLNAFAIDPVRPSFTATYPTDEQSLYFPAFVAAISLFASVFLVRRVLLEARSA